MRDNKANRLYMNRLRKIVKNPWYQLTKLPLEVIIILYNNAAVGLLPDAAFRKEEMKDESNRNCQTGRPVRQSGYSG